MKKLLYLTLFFGTQFIFSQSNSEIIRWLNDFENSNSPESIMEGTFDDKVFLNYDNGYLVINSMRLGPILLNGTSEIFNIKCEIKIADITQIEAIELNKGVEIIYDVKICTKSTNESIKIYEKKRNDSEYNKLSSVEYDNWIKDFGYCTNELRFKFLRVIAQKQLQRVYDALNQLAKNHNANPKIGSYF